MRGFSQPDSQSGRVDHDFMPLGSTSPVTSRFAWTHLRDTLSTNWVLIPGPVSPAHIKQIPARHRVLPANPGNFVDSPGSSPDTMPNWSVPSFSGQQSCTPAMAGITSPKGAMSQTSYKAGNYQPDEAWTAACPRTLDTSFLHRARFLRAPANPVTTARRRKGGVSAC